MKKEKRLSRKINRFLKSLGCSGWLHYLGPKTYQLWQHVFALVAIAIFRLSLKRAELLLGMLGCEIPTYSALCKSRKIISASSPAFLIYFFSLNHPKLSEVQRKTEFGQKK